MFGGVEMRLADGLFQRSEAFGIGKVDVCAGVEKQIDDRSVSLLCGPE
jgi:hypothetical protein